MTTESIFVSIVTGLTAAIVGAFASAVFTKRRETKTRKEILAYEAGLRIRQFQKYVLLCRFWLERIPHTDNDSVWKKYEEIAPTLGAEGVLVSKDFDSPEFDQLVTRAITWERPEANDALKAEGAKVKQVDLRDILRDSINAVWECTKKHFPLHIVIR